MGIDSAASIFVGLPRDDGDFEQLIDEDELEVCPPYYDGGSDGLVGFHYALSPDYSPCEVSWDQSEVDSLKQRFKLLTGIDAKVWLSPNIS
jgi:hypothetical protein